MNRSDLSWGEADPAESRKNAKYGPDPEADWRRVRSCLTVSAAGCWDWVRSVDTHGYGHTARAARKGRAA